MAGRFITDANIDLPAAACFTDMSPANIIEDGGFQIIGATFLGDGTPTPNMPTTNVKARVRNSAGLRDTYVGGKWTVSTEAETVVSAINTPVLVAGTTDYSDLEWFSQTTNNSFVYDSTETVEVSIHGHVSVTGTTPGDQITFIIRKFDATDCVGGGAYTDIASSGPQTMDRGQGSDRAESVGFIAYAVMDQCDRIELWGENNTDTSNFTLNSESSLTIEER